MAFPFKRILAPVDFDPSSLTALDLAAKMAKQNDGTVFVLHIVPVEMDVSGMPQYVDLIKRQESLDRDKLTAIAKQHLADVKWEILDEMGPAGGGNRRGRSENFRRPDRNGHARPARAGAPRRGQRRRESIAQRSVPGPGRSPGIMSFGGSVDCHICRALIILVPQHVGPYVRSCKKQEWKRCLSLISILLS